MVSVPAQLPVVGLVVAVCVAMATLGTLLAGDGLRTWYPALNKPWFQLPLPLFVAVGIVGYIMDGIILYRLLAVVAAGPARTLALVAVLVMMLYNELWNGAFFRLRSTWVGFLGIVVFLGPLLAAQAALAATDGPAAWLLSAYVVWVFVYDLPWAYALWRLNGRRRPPTIGR
jgi:tryptophan-rich sensory protein